MMKPNRTLIVAMLVGVLFALSAQAATEAEIKADLLSVKIVAAIDSKRFAEAERLFEQYDATGVQMPQSLKLQRAMVSVGLGKFYLAKLQLEAFLRQANRGAEGYAQALTMLTEVTPKAETDVAGKAEVKQAIALAIAKLAPKCKIPTSQDDDACWMKLENKPNCYTYQEWVGNNHAVAWSGICHNGSPNGEGTATKKWEGGSTLESGAFVDGKKHGHWVVRYTDGFLKGLIKKGPYVNGKRHGHWIDRHTDGFFKGRVSEGPYVEGKKHGYWVERQHKGYIMEGPYVDGEKHGHWVTRFATGDVLEGSFVNGKEHGRWVWNHGMRVDCYNHGEEIDC